ncbi:carboxylic acid reductase [Nocardia sp. NPDC020380]|uniref:carboxylic acid reductase n=1 Tax=Nocardia sp. NPDC020380 TaxID=3364309 RepID=UPI003789B1C0
MPIETREERLARRVAGLYATDRQFADARPDVAVGEAVERAGSQLPDIVRAVLDGYAERPALGQRAVRFVQDAATGRTSAELLPRFETITYRGLGDRVGALAAAWAGDPIAPGDRVCVLGFTSVDYATIDLALLSLDAVSVPLQASAAVARLQPVVAETEPTVIAASVDYLAVAVGLIAAGYAPARLVVFDYHPQVDDHREAVDAARARLAEMGSTVVVELLTDALERGATRPAPAIEPAADDSLALLIYTSGSTGTPKGAMYRRELVARIWLSSTTSAIHMDGVVPSLTLNFRPMSHIVGRAMLYGTLAAGGTAYFAATRDLSTFFEDLALVRPTQLDFVPRVWEMLFEEYRREVDSRSVAESDRAAVEAEVMAYQRQNLLGGRYVAASTGSAPLSADLRTWVESFTDMHLVDTFGLTESVLLLIDGRVQRPPVIDYKLVDVPDLGYFSSDRPYPRGELAVKSMTQFAGYYKRPELTAEAFDSDGYYLTGDIMAETAPDHLTYIDRRNNVLKLSQGEFITAAKLETVFGTSPLVRQIYVYANSTRSYPLAVVVPTEEALQQHDAQSLTPLIKESLREIAKAADLQSYELPREFIIETTPFAAANGLLTDLGKLAQKKLQQRYGERLEQLYAELAEQQTESLRALRAGAADLPVLDTVGRAAAAVLGAAGATPRPDAYFADLGGDSLSALTFGNLLREIFDVDVPVGVIVSPANDLAAIAGYIETERQGSKRPTYRAVHGRDATTVHAGDLTLDRFLDESVLANAPSQPGPATEVRTVLLTGATGFLGRYLALEWLDRMESAGGKVIALVRAKSDADARGRLDKVFDSGDPELLDRYRTLATDHLEVIAGDKGEAELGLDHATWQRLADIVDVIVDPAALVNHVLPYSEMFGPNTLGTAELIKLALTTKLKPYTYVSTIGVGDQIESSTFTEDADIRRISGSRKINDGYANGYGNSKWAGEVLLRAAHDLCGLPVAVFRCDLILADTGYAGQLNLPDMFTRLMLSVVATGVAPGSFYERDAEGNRQRAHFNGLPVEFVAEAISTLGAQCTGGFRTFHVMNPYDDGIGLDEFIDWLIGAGYSIQRVGDYDSWLRRFETTLRTLPERQRHYSLLPLLHYYLKPATPVNGSMALTDRFRAAVQEAKVGAGDDIPHVSQPLIIKYVTDLRLLGLL